MKNGLLVLLSIVLTVVCWGAFGPLLAAGERALGGSFLLPFIWVGVAYFLVAVLAAWALLIWLGEEGEWTVRGIFWSFLAGAIMAVGTLAVILTLTNKGSPIYVMPLIFGIAPVVSTLLATLLTKSTHAIGSAFYAGLILVIAGATVVLVFNPAGKAVIPITFAGLMSVLAFTGLAAICWGSYGPLLHRGQSLMRNSRLRPFVCMGLAYCVVAVLVPWLLRATLGDQGALTAAGALWSLMAGVAGALGSLGVILAFTFGGRPVYVMPLVFGGAPVVNTFISIAYAEKLETISPFFYAGVIVVVAGAVSVLIFSPKAAAEETPVATEPESAAVPKE